MDGLLCTGLISAWLNHVGSKHSWMVPFGFGAIIKLFHHSAVLSTSRCTIICCFCRCCSFFLNSYCTACATHLDIAWYGFVTSRPVTKMYL